MENNSKSAAFPTWVDVVATPVAAVSATLELARLGAVHIVWRGIIAQVVAAWRGTIAEPAISFISIVARAGGLQKDGLPRFVFAYLVIAAAAGLCFYTVSAASVGRTFIWNWRIPAVTTIYGALFPVTWSFAAYITFNMFLLSLGRAEIWETNPGERQRLGWRHLAAVGGLSLPLVLFAALLLANLALSQAGDNQVAV